MCIRDRKIVIQYATKNEISSAKREFGFDWSKLFKQANSNLINNQGMLIMNLIEVSKITLVEKSDMIMLPDV